MNWLRYNYDVVSIATLAANSKIDERRSAAKLAARQAERLSRLVAYARCRSPFYSELYRSVPHDVALEHLGSLPTVTKDQVMRNFDDVVTDRSVSLRTVLELAEDPIRVGQALGAKYFVARTSGTTGVVGHYVHDLFSYALIHTLTAVRSKGVGLRSFLGRHYLPRKLRIASLLSPVANFGVSSVMAAAPQWVKALVEFRLVNILDPWDAVIDTLNAFQPDVVGSFPTVLEQLADSRMDGRLRVQPKTVRSGGETLTPRVRQYIADAFACPVYDCYGCAESGWIGMECDEHHGIHAFSDWVLVEPVDALRRPVPPMVESDMVLITNLANYVQPFIRFEIPDRVTVLEGPCPCGSRLPRLMVKGRMSEVLHIRGGERTVAVPPFHLTTLAEMIPGIGRFQIILEHDHHLSVLFTPRAGASVHAVAAALQASFVDYCQRNGLTSVRINVVATDEIQKDRSGKTRQVLNRVDG